MSATEQCCSYRDHTYGPTGKVICGCDCHDRTATTQRLHGGLVMDLVCALEAGDYLAADDADFIEFVAAHLYKAGWRHVINPAFSASDERKRRPSGVLTDTAGFSLWRSQAEGLVASVIARDDSYGDIANTSGDLLRDALRMLADGFRDGLFVRTDLEGTDHGTVG